MSDDDLNDAIASVSAEAANEFKEAGYEPEIPVSLDNPDDTPVVALTIEPVVEAIADPAVPVAEVVPEVVADDPEPLGLSPEILAKINDSPELTAAHKIMQAGLTRKFQAHAAAVRADTENIRVANWIRENPDAALAELAQLRGRQLVDTNVAAPVAPAIASPAVTDEITKLWQEKLGDGATTTLKPIIDQTIEAVTRRLIEERIAPLQASTAQLTNASTEAGIAGRIATFSEGIRNQGLPWDSDISHEVADAMNRIHPAPGTTFDEFLTSCYNDVSYRRNRTSSRKTEISRLKAARASAEPSTTVRPAAAAKASITNEMSDDEAIRLAVADAERLYANG